MKGTIQSVLVLTAFVDFLGVGVVIPVAPYYYEKFGLGPILITSLLSVYSASQLVMSPVLGRASDILGRKPILMMGVLGESVSYLMQATASSVSFLFLARVLGGSFSATLPIVYSIINDLSDRESLPKRFGQIGGAVGAAFVVGPAIGGSLSIFGLTTPFLFSSLLAFLNLISISLLVPQTRRVPSPKRDLGKTPPLPFLLALTSSLVFVAVQSILALYVQRLLTWGPLQVGIILFFAGSLLGVSQAFLSPRLIKAVGPLYSAIAGTVMSSLGMISIIGVGPLGSLVVLGTAVTGIGYSLVQNSATVILGRVTTKGSNFGALQSMNSASNAFGPLLWGYFFSVDSYLPFLSSSLLALGVSVLSYVWGRGNG